MERGQNAEILLVGRDGELILQRRDESPTITNPGMITTFGGRVNPGETPVDAAFRELCEETSLRPSRDELVYWGFYEKNQATHGEDWDVYLFVLKDVDYESMQVFEGQGYVVVRSLDELLESNTSILLKEIAKDWYSGWRDFSFMPEPSRKVIDHTVNRLVKMAGTADSQDAPIALCPIGVVASGKTSLVGEVVKDLDYVTISSDTARNLLYGEGFNFRNALTPVFNQAVLRLAEKRTHLLLDTNVSHKKELLHQLYKQGYKIIIFYVTADEQYIREKIAKMDFAKLPERFRFFKTPAHVLSSYLSNRRKTLESFDEFFKEYPPDFTIDAPTVTHQELGAMRSNFNRKVKLTTGR